MLPDTRKRLTPWLGGLLLLPALVTAGPAGAQTAAPATAPSGEAAAAPPSPAAAPEEPEKPRRRRLRFGPQAGVYLPSNGKTRDRFGGSWVSYGVGFGSVRRADNKGRIVFDFSILTESRGDNRAFIAPIGVGYYRALAPPGPVTPYVGASVNLYLADLRSRRDDVSSGVRAGGGGSLLLGTTVGERGYVEARYRAISRIKGFDFSGLGLTAGLRF